MEKFSYGSYSVPSETVFAESKGYVNPSGEQETRYQLSKPLVEVKDFINKTVAVDENDKAVQLSVRDDTIKYRTTEDGEWADAISGSTEPDTETIASGDRLTFYDTSKEKVAKSSIQFGANANKYLRNDGTWQNVKCGVDMTNILFTKTIAKSDQTLGEFTSDYDGWLRVTNTDGHNTFSLDGVTIPRDADTQRMYLISKGTVIKRVNYYPVGSENDAGMTIVIYGLK